MSGTPSRLWTHTTGPRLDRQDPYLRIQHITIFIRDYQRSLQFYVEKLGFSLVVDHKIDDRHRWVAVAPPDGTAILALVVPGPDSKEYALIGRSLQIVFITEDVEKKFRDWSERGVVFQHAPRTPDWGGTFTQFEDVDGNIFALIGFDEATRDLETHRTAMREKLESERRAEQELAIAKQVQARLFPQTLPKLSTLEYAGVCIQARHVGGDYYDFLDLGRGRVALVIADISGKGIAAALLMANLQANVRSQSAIALDEPHRLLRTVNQVFYENTAEISYATLFFAEYDDKSRVLRYANCGHLSAILLRADHEVEYLASTATVVGLFKDLECPTRQVQLHPGDVLALYTDGITESFNQAGEEFGESRLVAALRKARNLSSQDLLASVIEEVQRFGREEQHDDITLIVAKCKTDGAAGD
jgi:serine phosphatase RsbU (regulator of sigma subunit)/predicted enzyme related to lactoylglutathione lyase